MLPNAGAATIDPPKITEYLLNLSHPDGGPKAKFYIARGYILDNWTQLADDLRTHGTTHPVSTTITSVYGAKYTIEGPMTTPDGKSVVIRSVWIINKGEDVPRFVTGYYFG